MAKGLFGGSLGWNAPAPAPALSRAGTKPSNPALVSQGLLGGEKERERKGGDWRRPTTTGEQGKKEKDSVSLEASPCPGESISPEMTLEALA